MRCPYCGQPNSENAHNCRRCGKRIDSVRERKKEKGILARGILLIMLIIAAGIAAMIGLMKVLPKDANGTVGNPKVTITSPTPTPVPTEEPQEAEEEAAAPEEAAEEFRPETQDTAYAASANVVAAEQFAAIRQGYLPVVVSESWATSTIVQEGVDNGPHTLYDGMDWSSWQDGVDGGGIGESVSFILDREYQIRGFAVRLGNWYEPEDYYYMNNRPERLTFTVGNESFSLSFPDRKEEMYVELSRDVPASQVRVTIDSVYRGTDYADTCINEITIYGI